jgi:hypothetical protein
MNTLWMGKSSRILKIKEALNSDCEYVIAFIPPHPQKKAPSAFADEAFYPM